MIDFGTGLLATLAEPAPHIIQTFEGLIEGKPGIFAVCTCGTFYVESMGRDESSRNAVKAAVRRHEKETAL